MQHLLVVSCDKFNIQPGRLLDVLRRFTAGPQRNLYHNLLYFQVTYLNYLPGQSFDNAISRALCTNRSIFFPSFRFARLTYGTGECQVVPNLF